MTRDCFFLILQHLLFWPYLRNYLSHIEEISPQHSSYSVVQKRSTTAPWEINILPAKIFFLIKNVDFKWIFRFFTFFSQISKFFISGVVLDNFNRSFAFDHKFYRLEGHICGYIFAPFKFVIFFTFCDQRPIFFLIFLTKMYDNSHNFKATSIFYPPFESPLNCLQKVCAWMFRASNGFRAI